MNDETKSVIKKVFLGIVFLWLISSAMTVSFRQPSITESEGFLQMHKVLTYQRLDHLDDK